MCAQCDLHVTDVYFKRLSTENEQRLATYDVIDCVTSRTKIPQIYRIIRRISQQANFTPSENLWPNAGDNNMVFIDSI